MTPPQFNASPVPVAQYKSKLLMHVFLIPTASCTMGAKKKSTRNLFETTFEQDVFVRSIGPVLGRPCGLAVFSPENVHLRELSKNKGVLYFSFWYSI